jgi:hypothetical protein
MSPAGGRTALLRVQWQPLQAGSGTWQLPSPADEPAVAVLGLLLCPQPPSCEGVHAAGAEPALVRAALAEPGAASPRAAGAHQGAGGLLRIPALLYLVGGLEAIGQRRVPVLGAVAGAGEVRGAGAASAGHGPESAGPRAVPAASGGRGRGRAERSWASTRHWMPRQTRPPTQHCSSLASVTGHIGFTSLVP